MLTTRACALLIAFVLSACAGAAAPTASPGAAATPKPTPTAVPGDPGTGNGSGTDPGSGGGSGGGGTGGDPGTGGGIVIPIPGDPNQNPLFGDANYLTPAPNLQNPRAMNVQLVRAIVVDDGTVTADLRWWSGVVPCNQLDHVDIVRDDAAHTIHLTVFEGSGPGDVMCIELAELHATSVDLGDLAAGSWTISAEGDAPAITLEVK
ncbi:MAG TPA: hypothetical protein VIF63_08775 [Candidatus Limnocylindrales bacterium]|jgi:hypothetical protein